MLLKIFPFLFLGLITSGVTKPLNTNHTAFDVVYEWKFLEYEYFSQIQQDKIMNNSKYDKTSNLLVDFDVAEDGRVFVVVNKNREVPSTLNTVSSNYGISGPLLAPFPDWSWHSRNDCIGIRSVYRIQIDKCNRLWVLDNGAYRDERICPAQLLMFDLSTNELQLKVNIPNEFFRDQNGDGFLKNMVLQSEGGWWCGNTNVYMSYFVGDGLVVWDGNKLWRVNGPDVTKLPGEIRINSYYFDIEVGIFGMAVSPKIGNQPQILALRSAATKNLFTAKIDDILATSSDQKNIQWSSALSVIYDAIIPNEPEKESDNKIVNYTIYEDVLPSSAAYMAFNQEGILFMGLTELTAIGCWNSNKDLTNDTVDVIDKDEEKLPWVSAAKVLPTSRTGNDEEELWIATTNIAEYVYNQMDFDIINYRIMKQTTSRILTNSKCKN